MPSVSKRRSRAWLGLALGALLAGWTATAQAFFGFGLIPGIYIPQTYYKFGAVYTRAVVLSPNGKPIWVEYGSDGKEAREIGEATGPLEQAQVMSGDIYRAYLQRLKDARERYPQSEVMTAATYRGTAFKTMDGKTIDKPTLSPSSLTVLVRGEKERFSTKGDELLLLQMPIDSNVTPSTSSKALLLSKEGQILHQGTNSIGFRAGFFGKDGKVDDKNTRDRDAKIYGPLPGVGVTLGSHVTGGYALTDDDGKYRMNYFLPPCPGFFFEYTTSAYLELYYKRFNPRGSSNMPYYLTRPDYDTCNGMGLWSLEAAMIVLTAATPMKQAMDFPIDLMVLDGSAQFGGGVKLGDKTAYSDKTGKRDHYLQEKYDFDGDGKPDWVVPGKKVTKEIEGKPKEVFVRASLEEAQLQGIYLSSHYDEVPANTEADGPDFTRLIDTSPDFVDRGLLESISKDDLKDTDIYVFRESNGQLVAERRGLHEDELYKNYSGVDEKAGSFRYTIQLRGSKENYLAMSGRTGEAAFSKWQSAGGFKEEFQKRAANHLKAGETVRIIAINRPTGYMGSTKVQLQSAIASGNLLNFAGQRIELAPPNLKVWAERKNKIEQGMTRGEVRKQLISNEGSGLGSDISIAIYTDWRDTDGSALPEELSDYGYTGRLAKIVAANQLAPVGANNLSQFKVKPGQQVQVIQLPEKVLAKQHLYLQVTGQPENRNPDFSSGGEAAGILKYRPKHYVPVRVPLFDEENSELARQAYVKASAGKNGSSLKKPDPIYNWNYRPELQFSLYDLTINSIKKIEYGRTVAKTIDLKKNVVASSDRLIELAYTLLQSEIAPLEGYEVNGKKEMVLAFGQDEALVTIGKDKSISFNNISHLAALTAEDYLSLRLYSNNDAGNVLWEWAFDHILLLPAVTKSNETIKVTADRAFETPELIEAFVVKPEKSKTQDKYALDWLVQGSATLSKSSDSNTTGYFQNSLKIASVAGQKVTVVANFKEPYSVLAYSATYEVVPGIPRYVSFHTIGKTVVGGLGGITLEATFRDRFGNLVADGTVIDISAEDMVVRGEPITKGGSINVTLVGESIPGTKVVKFESGLAKDQTTVLVHDVDLSVEVDPIVRIGSSSDVKVTANSGYGNLSGLKVQVNTLRGALSQRDVVIGSNNIANTRLDAGNFPGEGQVVARYNDKLARADFQVVSVNNGLRVSNPLMVSSRLGGPDPSQAGASANTEIQVPGTVGEMVSLDLLDYLKPNLLPVASWGLRQPEINGVFLDEEFGAALTSKRVQVESIGSLPQDSFAVLEEDSSLTLASKDQFDFESNFGVVFSFWAEATSTGKKIFDFPNSGITGRLSSGGRLEVVASLSDGSEVKLTTGTVAKETWHKLGVHIVGGKLIVQLDDEILEGQLDVPLATGGSQTAFVMGKGFQGRVNGLALYDWTQPFVLKLGNGLQKADAQVESDGYARFHLVSNYGDVMALRENENRGLLASVSAILIAHAVAADGNDPSCKPVMTSDLIGSAEAFLKFIVDCQLQKKIRQAEIKVKTASGFKQTTLAYMEYGAYVALQTQINIAGHQIIYLAQCLKGVVAGSTDSGMAMLCDFVASLLLVGDIRDFVIHGYYLFTGQLDKFDQATYVFATLGILGTFAELTGVGVTLDAALAGGKTAAKVMKGSKVLANLVGYLDKNVIKATSGKRTEALLKVLPFMEIVAVIAYEGGNIKDFMVAAIDSVDDFENWVEYSKRLIETKFASPDKTTALERKFDYVVGIFVPVANAAGIDVARKPVREFVNLLEEVQKGAVGFKARGDIAKLYTKVIKDLQHGTGNGSDMSKLLGDVIHKDKAVLGLIAIVSRADVNGLAFFRKSPCTPSVCKGMGKSVEEFLEKLQKLEAHFPDNAADLKNYDVFIKNFGSSSVNMARSVAGSVDMILRRATEMAASGKKIEVRGFEVPHGKYGNREYDFVIRVDGVDHPFEGKTWEDVAKAKEYLAGQVATVRESKRTPGTLTEPGQIVDDIINSILDVQNKLPGPKWDFSDKTVRDSRMDFVGHVMEELEKNALAQRVIMQRTGMTGGYNGQMVEQALIRIFKGEI